MRATPTLSVVLCTLLVVPFGLAQAIPQRAEAGFWYLLVRRAGRPEKNYYELTRKAQFVGFISSEEEARQYKPSPRNYGADIETDNTVRYDVYQARYGSLELRTRRKRRLPSKIARSSSATHVIPIGNSLR